MLEKAARDAADSDAPDLEIVSRSALAAVLQQAGEIEEASQATKGAESAARRDRHRDRQLRAVLAVAITGDTPGRSAEHPQPDDSRDDRPRLVPAPRLLSRWEGSAAPVDPDRGTNASSASRRRRSGRAKVLVHAVWAAVSPSARKKS